MARYVGAWTCIQQSQYFKSMPLGRWSFLIAQLCFQWLYLCKHSNIDALFSSKEQHEEVVVHVCQTPRRFFFFCQTHLGGNSEQCQLTTDMDPEFKSWTLQGTQGMRTTWCALLGFLVRTDFACQFVFTNALYLAQLPQPFGEKPPARRTRSSENSPTQPLEASFATSPMASMCLALSCDSGALGC